MMQINLKNIRQFRNCVNLLNCNQSTLAKSINNQENNEFDNSKLIKTQFADKQNDLLNSSNQLNNRFKLNHIEKLNLVNFNRSNKLLEKSSNEQDSNKPTREQIEEFHTYVEDNFPKFFTERINLAYFDEFITIEDNQSGITKKEFGFTNLVKKISFIRIYYSSMYSYNVMKVLSIAKIPEEGLIKLRWRISSKGRLLSFIQFWRIRNFRSEFWTDGIVYFYLNKNGKVKRLVIEKVEKDKDENLAKIPLAKMAKV